MRYNLEFRKSTLITRSQSIKKSKQGWGKWSFKGDWWWNQKKTDDETENPNETEVQIEISTEKNYKNNYLRASQSVALRFL